MEREKINLFEKTNSIKNLVVKNDSFMSIYLNCKVGEGLPNHTHKKMAQLLVFEGKLKVEFEDGGKYELLPGELLSFDSRIMHNVVALEPTKALVTVGL